MKYLLGILCLICFTWGCTKSLNQVPKDQISGSNFWTSPNDALLALNGCYAYLDGNYNNPYYDAYADNAFAQYPWESIATVVSAGNIDATVDGGYNARYSGIRRFNYFIDNVDRTAGMDDGLKKRYKAEARFLRAFTYFNLAEFFGAVPLLKTSYTDPADAAVAPAPENDVIEFSISELKAAATDLPSSYAGGAGNEVGRITKGAAMAMVARVELMYGKYADAATDAKAVMDMGYSLFKKTELTADDRKVDYSGLITFANEADKTAFYKGLASYEQQFWAANENNPEVILSSQNITNSSYVYGNGLNTLLLPGEWAGWGSITPTQSLVNDYWNRDGSVPTPPTDEYRALHFNKGEPDAQWFNEFKNRDTRLYASILFPTSQMLLVDGVNTLSWTGSGEYSKTGYYFRKMVDAAYNQAEFDGAQDFPIIRYAEVLLTYAEAKNEASGPDASVYNAINLLRDRATMPNVDQTLYGSQDKLRTLIREERRIELAGEGLRYYDMRRWGIAASAMVSIKNINNEVAQDRVWEAKFMKLPYPQTALDHNPKLQDSQKTKGY